MKTFLHVIQVAVLSFIFPLVSFADEVADHRHNGENDVVAIDLMLIIGVTGVVLLGGFIIWKFFLRKK